MSERICSKEFAERVNPFSKQELVSMEYGEFIKIPVRINPLKRLMCQTYSDMLQRCNNPKCEMYPWYGGKGVEVEISRYDFYYWFFKSYKKFFKKYPSETPTVNKIKNSSNYKLGNIELLTRRENCLEQNSRNPNPNPESNKLRENDVVEILTSNKSGRYFSKKFKVSDVAISRIRCGKNWVKIYDRVKGMR